MGNIKIKSVFKGLLASLLLITTVVMFLVDPSKYMNLGGMYTMGEFFENVACGCLVAFLIWKYLFKKKKSSGMYTFAAVILVLNFMRIFWPDHNQVGPEQKGWALFKQQIAALQRGDHISPQTYSTKDYGVVAKYLNVENQQLIDAQTINNQWVQDIHSHTLLNIGEDGVDLPQVLKEDQERAKKLEMDVVRYQISTKELWYKGLDEKVSKSNMTDQEKQGFYSVMNPIRSVNIQEIERVTQLEKNYYQVLQQREDFLINDEGNFKIQNHQIVFKTQADSEEYNSYLKKMNDLEQQVNLELDDQNSY